MEIRDNVIRKPYFLTSKWLISYKTPVDEVQSPFPFNLFADTPRSLGNGRIRNTSRRTVTLVQVHKITIGLPDM